MDRAPAHSDRGRTVSGAGVERLLDAREAAGLPRYVADVLVLEAVASALRPGFIVERAA